MSLISIVASSHSEYMAETEMVSHKNFPKRQEEIKSSTNAKTVGENIKLLI